MLVFCFRQTFYPLIPSKYLIGVNDFFFFSKLISQECDKFLLKKSTKYLAKNYFDRFIRMKKLTQQFAKPQYLNLLKSAAILIAIEFKEKNQQLKEQICKQLLSGSQSIKIEDFESIKEQLLKVLKEDLQVTTPYQFVDVFKKSNPNLKKKILLVQSLIDFCLTFENFADLTAEQRFFGCLLHSFDEEKHYQTKKEIENLTENPEKAKQLAAQLKLIYEDIIHAS